MPRILFPFTRAKLNSIARLAEEKQKIMIFIVGMKQKPWCAVSERQALADGLYVLARSCDPNLRIHVIAKVIKVTFNILNFNSTLFFTKL